MTPTLSYSRASVLLAHGSSDAQWLAPFSQLLNGIRDGLDAGTRVELAYMELAEPSLTGQVRALAHAGYQHIDVLPLFFAAGRHLRHDVPRMLKELQDALAQEGVPVRIELHSPVGLEPEVADAISRVVIRQVSQAD